jgi:hypothetical protein
MIAKSTASITLVGQKLRVDRVARWSDAVAILLVEGGEFSEKSVLKFSSKDAKGKIYARLADAPAPPGAMAAILLAILAIGAFAGFVALQILDLNAQDDAAAVIAKEADALETGWRALGWTSTESLARSELGPLYGPNSFPMEVVVTSRTEQQIKLDVRLDNKSTAHLIFSLRSTAPAHTDFDQPFTDSIDDRPVAPGSHELVSLVIRPKAEFATLVLIADIMDTGTGDVHFFKRIVQLPPIQVTK